MRQRGTEGITLLLSDHLSCDGLSSVNVARVVKHESLLSIDAEEDGS
jgi:hypothetical protein